jgi:hypothetical protein
MAFRRSPVRSRSGPPNLHSQLQLAASSCGTRQDAFCERQDAFHVEFIELAGVTVYPGERELLAQFLGVTVVRLDVDRAFEEERFVEAVELVLEGLGRASTIPIRTLGPL